MCPEDLALRDKVFDLKQQILIEQPPSRTAADGPLGSLSTNLHLLRSLIPNRVASCLTIRAIADAHRDKKSRNVARVPQVFPCDNSSSDP
jgi:hypothetical protein